jgi:hypothetical protein
MEFHQFTKFALADLNKRIRKEVTSSCQIIVLHFYSKFNIVVVRDMMGEGFGS